MQETGSRCARARARFPRGSVSPGSPPSPAPLPLGKTTIPPGTEFELVARSGSENGSGNADRCANGNCERLTFNYYLPAINEAPRIPSARYSALSCLSGISGDLSLSVSLFENGT